MVAVGDVVVGEELNFFTGMGELVESGEGDEDEVAHAIDVDGGTVREGFGEAAAKEGDHAGMKAGVREGASGGWFFARDYLAHFIPWMEGLLRTPHSGNGDHAVQGRATASGP